MIVKEIYYKKNEKEENEKKENKRIREIKNKISLFLLFIIIMNRFTNKQYLIDLAIKSLETQQPSSPTKVKCELHYGDDSYLRINLQPIFKNGIANFCDQRLRIPFSSEVSLVFKLIKTNKKQIFLGHYSLQIEKMLAEKLFHFKIRDRLEQSDAYVDFQCKIIDKQLLAESDTEEPELQVFPKRDSKSIATYTKNKQEKIKISKPLSAYNQPVSLRKIKETLPLPPQDYGKLVRQTEDILKKRQKFQQRQSILSEYSHDKYGKLQSSKIQSLRQRLNEVRRQNFNNSLILYIVVSVVAFVVGMKL